MHDVELSSPMLADTPDIRTTRLDVDTTSSGRRGGEHIDTAVGSGSYAVWPGAQR